MRRLTTEEFIKKSKEIHGDRYDYSKVNYITAKTKVCIICPKHGEFWMEPVNHLSGQNCPKCVGGVRLTKEEFITKANEVHNNKYDYSKVDYVNSQTKVCIICPEHGEFWQTPNAHLSRRNCPKCVGGVIMTQDEFIKRANEVHNFKYDYSKVEYKNARTKVCIICPEHGEFWQTPEKHIIRMQGCPKCKVSELEHKIMNLLKKNNIDYMFQYPLNWEKNPNGHYLRLDFYLPKYNLAIECQGRQHFEPVNKFGGEERFLENIERDKRKFNLCKIHNIDVLYFTETKRKEYPYPMITNFNDLISMIKKME